MNQEIRGRKEILNTAAVVSAEAPQEVESKLIESGQPRTIRHSEVGGGAERASSSASIENPKNIEERRVALPSETRAGTLGEEGVLAGIRMLDSKLPQLHKSYTGAISKARPDLQGVIDNLEAETPKSEYQGLSDFEKFGHRLAGTSVFQADLKRTQAMQVQAKELQASEYLKNIEVAKTLLANSLSFRQGTSAVQPQEAVFLDKMKAIVANEMGLTGSVELLIRDQFDSSSVESTQKSIDQFWPGLKIDDTCIEKPEGLIFDPKTSFQERVYGLSHLLLKDIGSASAEDRAKHILSLVKLYEFCEADSTGVSSGAKKDIANPALVEPVLGHLNLVLKDLKALYPRDFAALRVARVDSNLEPWQSGPFGNAKKISSVGDVEGIAGKSSTDFIDGVAPVRLPDSHPLQVLTQSLIQDPAKRMPHQQEAFYAYFSKNPNDTEGLYNKWYTPKKCVDGSKENRDVSINYGSFKNLKDGLEAIFDDKKLSDSLSSLLLHPGVLQHTDAFFAFLKKEASTIEASAENSPESHAWDTLQRFKQELGTVVVYRGMVTDDATAKKIKDPETGQGEGILALSELYNHRAEVIQNIMSPSRHHTQPGLVDYSFARFLEDDHAGDYAKSPFISLTEELKVASCIGQSFARDENNERVGARLTDPNQKLRIYEIQMSRLDHLHAHTDSGALRFCNLSALISGDTSVPFLVLKTEKKSLEPTQKQLTQARSEDYRKGPHSESGGIIMGESYLKLSSNRLESFALGSITPDQIKEVIVKDDGKARAFGMVATLYSGEESNPFYS